MNMPYRRLGRSGLQVSLLSFGSWVTFDTQLDTGLARACMEAAWEGGVNFFDNAESYAAGKSEEIMGQVFADTGWPRHEYVVSSKYYWGLHDTANMRHTLNRKYLMQAVDASLERMQLDFLDLVFCHRADSNTPIEETVWAMNDLITSGRVHYWGTSEWPAADIRAAWEIAERHHLHKPVMEQPQYNLLARRKVEREYARLYEDTGLGLTTWSPLGSGLLTGKYLDGVPEGSRGSLPGYEWLADNLSDEEANAKVAHLVEIAADLDVTPAQLAIAWVASNPHVSTVILGASSVDQVTENLGALEALEVLTDDVKQRLDEVF